MRVTSYDFDALTKMVGKKWLEEYWLLPNVVQSRFRSFMQRSCAALSERWLRLSRAAPVGHGFKTSTRVILPTLLSAQWRFESRGLEISAGIMTSWKAQSPQKQAAQRAKAHSDEIDSQIREDSKNFRKVCIILLMGPSAFPIQFFISSLRILVQG